MGCQVGWQDVEGAGQGILGEVGTRLGRMGKGGLVGKTGVEERG